MAQFVKSVPLGNPRSVIPSDRAGEIRPHHQVPSAGIEAGFLLLGSDDLSTELPGASTIDEIDTNACISGENVIFEQIRT